MEQQFMATIWDGEDFVKVTKKEARRLVKEDKAQDLTEGFIGGAELKFRHEFTGYTTREIRAEVQPVPVQVKPLKPADWKDFKAAAAKELGKPFNKTTKADTLKFMENFHGELS